MYFHRLQTVSWIPSPTRYKAVTRSRSSTFHERKFSLINTIHQLRTYKSCIAIQNSICLHILNSNIDSFGTEISSTYRAYGLYSTYICASLCMRNPHWRNEDKCTNKLTVWMFLGKNVWEFERLCLIVTCSWFINDTYDCCK